MSGVGRWGWLGFVAGVALVLFAAYGQVLTRGPFGINDDYQYLYRTHTGVFDPGHNELMGMGRPTLAWADQVVYGLCAGKVTRLEWLRAGSLVGMGVLAWGMRRVLTDLGYRPGFAATVAVLAVLTPAAGVFAGYASGMFAPWALCAALAAGWLLVTPGGNWRRGLAAGGLIVLAATTWQAAVPLAMFPVLAHAWRGDGRLRKSGAPPWWRPWLVEGLAVGCYVALCLGIAHGHVTSAGGTERLAVATDPVAKARFLAAVLRCGVTSWARLQVGPWEWIVGTGTTVLCLCALPVWRDGLRTARRAGLAACMVLLSVAPLLAAREDNGAFRSLVCLYVTVTFLGVTGARRLLSQAPGWTRAVVAVLAVAAAAGTTRYHVWHGLIAPNLREYAGLRDEVRRRFPDGMPPHLVYLLPPFVPLAEGRLTASWEYGLTSSAFWWVTRPFLLEVFADALPDRPLPADPVISYREAGNPGVPVLSPLPVILREEGEWRDDPRWGRVRAFRGGWQYSPWFGYFNARMFPYIQHHFLGGLLFAGPLQDGGELWFYHEGLGHFHTDAGTYPRLLLGETNRWLTLSDDHPANMGLSDDLTHERRPYPPWH